MIKSFALSIFLLCGYASQGHGEQQSCPIVRAMVKSIVDLSNGGDAEVVVQVVGKFGLFLDDLSLSDSDRKELFQSFLHEINLTCGTNYTPEEAIQLVQVYYPDLKFSRNLN